VSRSALPHVLVVEDSEPIRSAFTILLEESGYAVTGAATGAEALRAACESAPDLVLLDLGLPDMSGLRVVVEIKASPATAAIPVVALTGRDEDDDRRALLDAGCTAYLVKPVDTQALLRALPAYIATRS
jgi:CheY-like chemotaxis protein